MKTYYTLIIVFFLTQFYILKAQDVHFSQYYFSPLTLNPANTGNYDGDYRFFANYRSQWREIGEAYDTYSAGGDFNFFPGGINCSGGFLFLNDRSGGNLNVSKILPSLGLHHAVGGFVFHAGIQPGLVIKTIDFYNNTYPNQLNWNTGQFDNTLPNMENDVSQRFSFLDLNLGAAVTKRFGKFEPELGYAWFHVNKPKESFLLNNDNRIPIRQMANLLLRWYAGKHIILEGHSMYGFTSQVSDWVSGLNIEVVLNQNPLYRNSVFFGAMWRSGIERNPDAGIITAGFHYEKYTFGFSYDVTLSQLKTSVDMKGAFEIAIIYKAFNNRLPKREVSCDRF
ncbi:MAG: PorP/SprF family type IX secretion system membrane protein [Bacteroidia bacterium]|nr:PorP/SprF family type IX secretion system membrane protein [Bacteroidia bacterium]